MSERDDDVTPQRKRIAVAVSANLPHPLPYLVCGVCARLTYLYSGLTTDSVWSVSKEEDSLQWRYWQRRTMHQLQECRL
jgi:hypothetical protein